MRIKTPTPYTPDPFGNPTRSLQAMADDTEKSFGAALYDSEPADGCASPDQYAPETWRDEFPTHADGEALSGVFQSGRAGRDYVLGRAPRAQLRLSVDSGEGDVWGQRLHAVAQCLRTRGTLPTSLRLQCSHSPDTPTLLAAVPPALQGAGAGVTEIAVVFPRSGSVFLDAPENHAGDSVTQFLQQIAPVLPGLSSLSLQWCFFTLAPPPAFPSLTALSLLLPNTGSGLWSSLFISAGRYLPQLRSLEIITPRDGYTPWQYLFTPAHITHTLTHFTTISQLNDQLLSLLVNHVPALQSITSRGVYILSDYSHRQWALKQLVTGQKHVGLEMLACLPRSTADRVSIVGVAETSVSMTAWHQVSISIRAWLHSMSCMPRAY